MKYLWLLSTFASLSAFAQNLILEGGAQIKPLAIETPENCNSTATIRLLDTPYTSFQLGINDQNADTLRRHEEACHPPELITFFPSFFTPNEDGVKDVFRVIGARSEQYHCRVFNRWGELCFESNDISKPWDGNSNGEICKQDSYIWICSYIGFGKKEVELSGTIVLFR